MSSFQDKHDAALLDSPWLTKTIDGDTWLFKYSQDPDRAGYIFLATDLNTIYFESLNAPSIPSRLSEIASRQSQGQHSSQSDVRDVVSRSERTLRDLGEWCGANWDEVEMTVRPDHFYDKIFGLTAAGFEWAFNVAELDLRRCVPLLAKHLILPMAKGLALANDIKVPAKATPAAALSKILATESVASSINPAAPARSAPTKKGKSSPRKEPETVAEVDDESPAEQEEETQDYVSGSEPEPEPEPEAEVEETQSPPSAQKSSSAKRRKRRISSGSAESPKEEQQAAPEEDAAMASDTTPVDDERKEGSEESEGKVAETLLKSQSKPLQKSRKEREREEEDEMERRREEMKRKMEHGGGGRLGKRRLRR